MDECMNIQHTDTHIYTHTRMHIHTHMHTQICMHWDIIYHNWDQNSPELLMLVDRESVLNPSLVFLVPEAYFY